ncbi:hypothetical protein FB45DRAFT_764453 [Roridomyces roridus]|uniref:FAD-binding PCMH-type domain-containing protein n=1 Tax=Roridomyces roridus TaxID=1738132 RepID=A0AAD7F7H6_9AGAR|nr:hypothetical protein FB45DRAFT_764453 [Roridomyces roridus]
METIQDVQGLQFTPADPDYAKQRDQYASSSYPNSSHMNPGLIVQPFDVADIKLVIEHARENNIAIAIRSGGHQYSGASSTSSNNIQLDLRNTFKRRDVDLKYLPDHPQGPSVRASVSYSLDEFHTFLASNGVFVGHGQCSAVHLGGHVQTGGYGLLGRSFGLLADSVTSLHIVDHAGVQREITPGDPSDLFFAILGGSPGNFGVLTHFVVKVQRDVDHEGSVGMRAVHLYSKEKLATILGYLANTSDDVDFPRNYDLCVSVMSENCEFSKAVPGLEHKVRRDLDLLKSDPMPPVIFVFAQFVSFGDGVAHDPEWFERFEKGSIITTGVETKPVSELMRQWIMPRAREYPFPYVKRTYCTNSTALSENGWAQWATDRMDAIVAPKNNGQFLVAQLQAFGGKHSVFARNGDKKATAFSWRDTTLCMVLDNFHLPENRRDAEAWAQKTDDQANGPEGMFSTTDRRVLWGSYGNFNLDAVWRTYYEDEEKYERLKKARVLADPDGTFTPNSFCVPRAVDSTSRPM